MTNDTTSMEMNSMLEVENLVQLGKSILDCLASETLSCSQKAQKLRDPVLSICRLLLAVKKDDDWETIRRWVREVSKALYEASDLVDTAVADGAALAASSSLVSKVRCRSLCGLSRSSGNSLFGVRMGPIINRLCQTLSQLKQEATDTGPLGLGLEEVDVTFITEPLPVPVVTPLPDHLERVIVGRDYEIEYLVRKLLDTRDLNHSAFVISIVGPAGLGKTTLAQLVYNDYRITYYFDLKLWVCVSNEFETEKILKSIILSISPTSIIPPHLGLEQLIDLLRTRIRGKLILLVLDDVKNDDCEKWLSLWTLLQVGARGSRVLLTTRSCQVAMTCQSYSFELYGLNDANSWSLFNRIAFGSSNPPENIFSTAVRIINRLANVPLAIAVLASFLRGISVAEWEDACSHIFMPSDSFESFDTSSSYLMPILKQSFNSLPPPVKLCFAYCSLFPEDHVFSVSDLVSLWIAQGYIRPENNQDDLEDIATQYFLILSNRFFFINKACDVYGNIATCQMHDLVRDMAIAVSEEWGPMKHVSLFQKSGATWLRENWLKDEHRLQSLICWIAPEEDYTAGRININNIVEMSSIKSLRVLDLQAFGLQVLPDSIGNLIHIRYLDLSHNKSLLKLPNKISNLHHLQTLKLEFCSELKELPTTFGKLVCLRRLEIDGCDNLTCMPPGFENLSSLQILSRYVVGRPRLQSVSGLAALGNLNQLQNRLMIELSDNWPTTADEAQKSNLRSKRRLTKLGIKWGPTRCTKRTDTVQHQLLLDGLQPPTDLRLLQIEGYKGQDFPSWARGNTLSTALPNLFSVSIDGCGQTKTLPTFSCLRHLRHLSLRFMENVQYFENSDNLSSTSGSPYFPSLEDLTMHSFYNLEGWWKEEKRVLSASFSCLRKLKMWSCPKLTSMPLFPDVQVLDMQNINEKLLESHSSWVTRSELQTSMLPSSSQPEISNIEQREHSQSLKYLTTVQIKSCPRLKTLKLIKSSKNLKKLVLERLDMLSSLTEVLKQLALLKELEIAGCKDLDLSGECQDSWIGCEKCDVPWNSLLKLECLTLRELPKLVTLPVGLRFIKNLRILCISTCSSLSKLPELVSNLTSLKYLKLEGCPAIKMLPEGLKDISSLVKIDILECPQLMERCREGGEDWHKIKHARVLCHKSWRYALMSETDLSQMET